MSLQKPEIALDVHAHLAPVVPDLLAHFDGVEWDADRRFLTVDGHAVGIKSLFDPDALRSWMASNGVAHAWISVPPPLYRQQLRGVQSRAWSEYLNDGLFQLAGTSGGLFSALIHLPTEEPGLAAELADDWIEHGHRLFAMPAGTGDERTLGDADFEPLWTALDAAKAFVFFHPGECADGRLKSFYLTNLLGNPYETTVAIGHLVLSGVLERHPRIVPCFAHGGGLVPSVAGRWERGYATTRPGIKTDLLAPSALLSRIMVDCICHSEAAAEHADRTFGADNVVFGSDWPFPMGLVEPHRQLTKFSEERRNRYLNENPKRLVARFHCSAEESA